MKSFVIFAIVVTIIYVIYYTVIIVQDLYGKPKDEKSQGESFDVSDMTDEEESIAVSESDGGFSVGDNQYETAYEEKQLAEPTEEAAATAEESKPHVLEKIQSAIEKKMEEVNTTYSDPMYSEELNNTFQRSVNYMELYRVVDFAEHQTLIQQLCGLKSVTVLSMDRTTPKLEMTGISNSYDVVSVIRTRVETNKRRKGVYEITNR